ncbi:MAG: outer membrane beta-barrel protein [Novosphingobium sp.]|jgi:outer membrane immunogenic protein|nr:outer membrane beta-barrel protein [Novosphingobium sp.]
MKKVALITTAAAALAATPVLAKDTEAYAGPIFGWDHVRISTDGGSDSRDGFVYGGVIGVQTKIGGAGVVGLEGEITGSSAKERVEFTDGTFMELKAGRDLFIGARAGVMVTETTQLYAKAGYTNARFTYREGVIDGVSASIGNNFGGYRIGAGVEQTVSERIRLRGEYRFSDYGNLTYAGYDLGASGQRHQILVGATYAF